MNRRPPRESERAEEKGKRACGKEKRQPRANDKRAIYCPLTDEHANHLRLHCKLFVFIIVCLSEAPPYPCAGVAMAVVIIVTRARHRCCVGHQNAYNEWQAMKMKNRPTK